MFARVIGTVLILAIISVLSVGVSASEKFPSLSTLFGHRIDGWIADGPFIQLGDDEPQSFGRFIRKAKDDEPSSSAKPVTAPEEELTSDDAGEGIVDKELVDAICNEDPTENKNNGTAESKESKSKAKLACAILKKLSKKPKKGKKHSRFQGSDYLPEDYNKFEVPRLTYNLSLPNGTTEYVNKAVQCYVFLNIRGIRNFDETDELVSLDMDIALVWTDGNILNRFKKYSDLQKARANKPVVINPIFLQHIWTPDIYFEEVVSLSQPTFMGNSLTVVLHPSLGLIVYRARVISKLSCEMDFSYYPADTQKCSFTIKSFSYISQNMELAWLLQGGTGVYLQETSDPNFDYQISSFSSEQLPLELGPGTDRTVNYTTLGFQLLARRKMTYHLVQTYFASVFFVIVTWLCFLIPPDMFEVRVAIAMSTLLTLTAMFSSVRESTPIVSYVKAIDVWMVSCIFFIFIALAGFTATAWIKRGLKKIRRAESREDEAVTLDTLMHQNKNEKPLDEKQVKRLFLKYRIVTILIESYALYILSSAYMVFNIIYWSWLFYASNYLNWTVNPDYNNVS